MKNTHTFKPFVLKKKTIAKIDPLNNAAARREGRPGHTIPTLTGL